jgi:cytochrome bd-type quinol oxidase subunit 2
MTTPHQSNDARLISFMALRKAIGWLGLTLPAAMLLGNYIIDGCTNIQDSNSHYYYTVTGDLFVGILCAVGLFLFTYKGYTTLDNWASSLAGVCAVLIAMFPTNDNSLNKCSNIVQLPISHTRNLVHYGSAAMFFTILALMSLFLFTKSKGKKSNRKRARNRIYRICGAIMLLAIATIAVYGLSGKSGAAYAKYHPVFWLEWVALLAFGTSWLVKGELVLKEKTKIHTEEYLKNIPEGQVTVTGSH